MHAPTRTAALQQAQEGWLTGPGALSGVALFPSRKGRLVLIWGLSATSVGLTTAVYVCDRCGTNAAHRLTKRVRRFTLFFVPLFSVSTTYVEHLHRLRPGCRSGQGAGQGRGSTTAGGPAAALSSRRGWPPRPDATGSCSCPKPPGSRAALRRSALTAAAGRRRRPTSFTGPKSGGRGAGSDREQQFEHPLRAVVHHVVPGVPLVVGPRRVGGNTLGG